MFTVGQLARLTGLTVRALHHYDAIGLLSPSQRSESGYRLYSRDDVARLFRIQALQNVGLSLAEIEHVLARGGALPDLIAQQLTAVELQIEHASALKARLEQLQTILQRGDEPATEEWLSAVELIAQYGSYCSHEEIQRLLAHARSDADDWRRFATDLQRAVDAKLPHDSTEARRLLKQWRTLLVRRAGGDLSLIAKMKTAYSRDESMRSRFEAMGNVSAEMMAYLGEAMMRTHRALWSNCLSPHETAQLRFDGRWQHDLLPTIGALSEAMSNAESRTAAFDAWRRLLLDFAGGDASRAQRIETTLLAVETDSELIGMWFLSDELRDGMRALPRIIGISAARSEHGRLQ